MRQSRIPERMKGRLLHLAPVPRQCLASPLARRASYDLQTALPQTLVRVLVPSTTSQPQPTLLQLPLVPSRAAPLRAVHPTLPWTPLRQPQS